MCYILLLFPSPLSPCPPSLFHCQFRYTTICSNISKTWCPSHWQTVSLCLHCSYSSRQSWNSTDVWDCWIQHVTLTEWVKTNAVQCLYSCEGRKWKFGTKPLIITLGNMWIWRLFLIKRRHPNHMCHISLLFPSPLPILPPSLSHCQFQ
jgi:hypothetical protein